MPSPQKRSIPTKSRERLAPQGSADLVGGAPEVLGNLVKSEIGKWSKVVRESGAKAD